ncbi:FtsX-like permease family protein [Nocardioides sp.]|uniref:FtsX-like permease family protein n=1 Tax=Nocardioides sp. TaxID=35761 RepID=UPI00286E6AB7|nr:FtsX-like permease family protein [Nocardioides sp.]
MRGWRPALRLAWRDALRARGRSILVLVMIALPVLAVTAAAVVQATSDVNGVDAIPRTMGAAAARIQPLGGTVLQAPDPDSGMYTSDGGDLPTLADLTETLGDREVITIAEGYAEVPLGDRRVEVLPTEVDLRDPLADGLFDLHTGALPAKPGEVVINDAFARRGVAIGDTIDVLGQDITVVGIGRDATNRDPLTVAGLPGSFGPDFTGEGSSPDWLVGGDPLLWSDVQALNKQGGLVYSRAVIEDPPPVLEMAEQLGYDTGYGDYVAIVSLIIAMALLEVVLLAGPAFAVSARRQARTLALMAACGGTPRQARRVVLASGVVLGAVAALVGAVLGVLLGLAVLPFVQTFSSVWFGPIDVNWLAVAIVAACGVLSAFLAAVVPAWLASRQDVVAVLAGRRGDAPPSARTPIFGVVLLGVGIALSVLGVRGGEFAIALGAIVAVFGMIFIVPLVVSVIARLSGRFPLVMRYAARDAARHRTRTVPAIAAVAATVAGVVALGIANTSDEAQNRETYVPAIAMGAASVSIYPGFDPNSGEMLPVPAGAWDRVTTAVRERLPDAEPEVLLGQTMEGDGGSYYLDVLNDSGEPVYGDWGGSPSNAVDFVSDGAVPGILDVDDAMRERMATALEAGRAVVLSSARVDSDSVTVQTVRASRDAPESDMTRLTWPAEHVQVTGRQPVQLLLPTALAEETGQAVTTVGLYLSAQDISEQEEQDLNETLAGIDENASIYVERGYQAPDAIFILLLVLFTLGGVLMLGGTLTATFLALSDARPDLATLSAVGAAPRSRRGVAASYALVVGSVGAVLGALVGFIPGVAITFPLTSTSENFCSSSGNGPMTCGATGPFLDIPWLLIVGLVIALPLLTALIVGLTARSRLPLAARLT